MDASAFEAHQKETLQACQAGDLSWLQQLYQTRDIQPGAKSNWIEKADRSDTAFELFMTTIIHEHVPILCYFLTMHPQTDLDYEFIARAIIDHPNLEIMKFLHAHHPSFINLDFSPLQTFLTKPVVGVRVGGMSHIPT